MKKQIYFITIIAVAILACKAPKPSVVNSQKIKQNTSITFNDGIELSLPGDWQVSSENKLTNQKFFRNKDSVLLALSVNPMSKYSFYSIGMQDTVFTSAFYMWESGHYTKSGYDVKIIERQYNGQYIIFSAKKDDINATLLYGGKKNKGYSLIILDPRKLTLNQQKSFLIQMYRDN
jgi:hypothetical protein